MQFDLTVNKYGWHDPQARIAVLEEDVADTISGERPAEPLFFRAKSGECIEFRATNLVPSALNLDDFQIFSATDTIGQHIHLVKFDVTSSDGSANGWNYEDGTLSPDEVRERLHAHNEQAKADNEPGKFLKPKVHPMFSTTKTERHFGSYFNSLRSRNGQPKIESRADCAADNWWTPEAAKKNPWCGAQTTVQRWFADPVFNRENHDRTLRSVFTHDHFGPSSHQQHGLYAALVIEPRESKWQPLNVEYNERDKTKNVNFYGEGKMLRNDGGPTSFAANIIFPDSLIRTEEQAENPEYEQSFREYNLAFADFAIVYTGQNRPVNAPNRVLADLPKAVEHTLIPKPEAISAEDPGTQVLNYRNEPIPLRIAEMKDKSGELMTQKTDAQISQTCIDEVTQERVESTDRRRLLAPPRCAKDDGTCIKRLCNPGDMANVFSSLAHKVKPENDTLKNYYPTCTAEEQKYGKTCGEPFQKIEEGKGTDKKTIIESARQEGDPATPILSAYANDRVQIRLVQGAQEEQHIFSMHGVKWLSQPGSHGSGFVNGQHIGISEHFEAQINPGTSPVPIDHFYSSSTVDNLWDGMWGLLRVFPANKNLRQTGLARLPGFGPYPVRMPDKDWSYSHPSNPANRGKVLDITNQRSPLDWTTSALGLSSTFVDDPTNPCDGDDAQKMPLRIFDVHAVPAKKLFGQQLVYNEKFGLADPNAIVFVKNNEYYRTNVTNEYDNLAKRYKEVLESNQENKNSKKIPPLTVEQLEKLAQARNKNNYFGNQGDTELVDDFNLLQKIQQGNNRIEPLILRARAGECIEIRLTNELPSEPEDGPDFPGSWSWNQLPAIVDNFNFNQFKMSNRVSLHPQLVAFKPLFHDGSNVGLNYDSTVAPGETKSYKWYAGDRLLYYEYENGKRKNYTGDYRHTPIEFGAISLTDWGDVIKHSSHGAIGALIIEPEDAQHPGVNSPDPVVQAKYRNPKYLAQEDRVGKFGLTTAASATILTEKKPFREFVVLYQDDVSFQQHGNPVFNLSNEEDSEDTGGKAFNYRTEPLWARMGVGSGASFEELRSVDQSSIFSNWEFGKDGGKLTDNNWNTCQGNVRDDHGRCLFCEDGKEPINNKCTDGKPVRKNTAVTGYGPPATPMFTATVGDAVRFRIVQPSGHPRQHTFTVYGHSWPEFPWNIGEPHYLNRKEENYYIKGSYKLVDKGRFKPDGQPLNGAVPTGNIVGAVNGIGPMRHFNLLTTAGGKFNVPGQYMYRTIDSFNLSGGLWGIFDVQPKPEKPTEPLAFTTRPNVNARNISKRYSAKRRQ